MYHRMGRIALCIAVVVMWVVRQMADGYGAIHALLGTAVVQVSAQNEAEMHTRLPANLSQPPDSKPAGIADCNVGDHTDLSPQLASDLSQLQNHGLCQSYQQHLYFHTKKDQALAYVKENKSKRGLLHGSQHSTFWGFNLNANYTFRHIFKNGGTTVELLKGDHCGTCKDCQKCTGKKLTFTVRDPIDHFFSGWAECGERGFAPKRNFNSTYDRVIQKWIKEVQGSYKKTKRGETPCHWHSFPQSWFLLKEHKETSWEEISWHKQVESSVVGSLKELPDFLRFLGMEFEPGALKQGRDASTNEVKKRDYNSREAKASISDETLLMLCRLVRMDYYVFDFDPPAVCKEEIEKDRKAILAQAV